MIAGIFKTVHQCIHAVIDCGPPPSPGGCVIAAQTLNPTECGSVVMYSPIENYTIVGDTSLMCGVNGQWEPDVGEALPVCFPSKFH